MPLHTQSHTGIDISSEIEVLSYTNDTGRDLVVVCQIIAGSVDNPITGSGAYLAELLIDDVQAIPTSPVTVAAIGAVIMSSREVLLNDGQTITAMLTGRPGDTVVDVVANLGDMTPVRRSDILGNGTVPVDHDYGGTDALRVLDNVAAPVASATITAYSKADYDAGNRASIYIKGLTTTKPDGRWLNPISLMPGEFYLIVSKPGEFQTTIKALTVS